MEMFRTLYGSWPEWEGKLDSGDIVFVRIRHGQVWIGKAATGQAASDAATMVKENMRDYFGVTDIVEALEELRQQGYYFVPPVHAPAEPEWKRTGALTGSGSVQPQPGSSAAQQKPDDEQQDNQPQAAASEISEAGTHSISAEAAHKQ